MAIWTPSQHDLRKPGTASAALTGILDAASMAVLGVSLDGRFVYGNETSEALLGYDHYELTNR